MPSYDLTADFASKDGAYQVSPHWLMCVVRFKEMVSFDRSKTTTSRSHDNSDDSAVAEREPLLIYGDAVTIQTTTSKSNHVATMSAQLLKSDKEYLSEILPGDWVVVWMTQSKQTILDIASRIKQKAQCNKFNDGIKFLGRIDNIRKMASRDRSTGMPSIKYSVTASGFTELDSKILYDPRIAQEQTFGKQLARMGKAIREVTFSKTNSTEDGGALDINKILPFFVNLLLGDGPPADSKNPSSHEELQQTPNTAYLIPSTIASLFGIPQQGAVSYADILKTLLGVQHYPDTSTSSNDFKAMVPDVSLGLSGEFVQVIPPLNNIPVWSILQQFLNAGVNEMYTCIRVTDQGTVSPHLVVRQLPFTTQAQDSDSVQSNVSGVQQPTKFLELPRWKISPNLVWDVNIGRSNANRFNWVHIAGVGPGTNMKDTAQAYIKNLPIRDDLDIKRSGLRPYTMTVNCSIKQAKTGTKDWTEHMTDILMTQHLTLSGTITMVGIQSPICEGDNFEFEGVVYHIEGVTHNCFMSGSTPVWETTLLLSHGMSNEHTNDLSKAAGGRDDEAQYALILDGQSGTFDTLTLNENELDTKLKETSRKLSIENPDLSGDRLA